MKPAKQTFFGKAMDFLASFQDEAISIETLRLQSKKNVLTLLWGSDWHLDHLSESKREEFYAQLAATEFDALVIAGDTELARKDERRNSIGVLATLKKIQQVIKRPVFFICGNHDYYLGSISGVRKTLFPLKMEVDQMLYLREEKVLELSQKVAIIGHEGWADGRSGNFENSDMALTDFFEIEELKVKRASEICQPAIKIKMQQFADLASIYAKKILPTLFHTYNHIYFVTHYPPFREAALYNGKPSDDNAVPFFVNHRLGEELLQIMKKFDEKTLTVLCGHTHHVADYSPLKNLRVLVSKSDYGAPSLEQKIVISLKEQV